MNDHREESLIPDLLWDAQGLIPVIVQDEKSGLVLMMAWMNEEALERTLTTGQAHYWSRSRQSLWHKGATSGAYQAVLEIRVDCDQDCLLLIVRQEGAGACHTGRPSCFYRTIANGSNGPVLSFTRPKSV